MARGSKPAKDKEAKPSVTRKSPKDDGARVGDLEKRLEEALKGKADALKREAEGLKREAEAQEQQAASAEILRIISSSPTDAHPVFEFIARSARRLCEGDVCTVARYDGELLHLTAHASATPEGVAVLQQLFPTRPTRATVSGRAVLESTVVHIPDLNVDAEYTQPLGQALRARSALGVPMLREGRPIGVIALGRTAVGPFTEAQISLLQTFAAQAVIAIENVRLFTELQDKNRALTDALERETATAQILRVISRSPTELQPVLDAVAESAARLCDALDATILLRSGDEMRAQAHFGPIPQ